MQLEDMRSVSLGNLILVSNWQCCLTRIVISTNPYEIGLCLSTAWNLEKDDQLLISTGLKFLDTIRQKATDMGLGEDFLYLNDASSDQKIMEGYGKTNLNRLRRISKKFDPEQVFQKQVTGGFKLS